MDWSPGTLFKELQVLDEHTRVEAKRGSEIGKSIMQTVCAFANEPGLGGGYLLLGVREPDTEHNTYWIEGVKDPDTLLNNLQNNCRNQFEQSVDIESQHVCINGKLVVGVYVPELSPAAKPCRFKGKHGKPNKTKTGVWRRGINGDYECTEQELEPLLLAKSGLTFEQSFLPDLDWGDLDPEAIALYRKLRSNVKPHAEELQASDEEMLSALNLVNKQYKPNLAGLLLLGKPLALRRLLPAIRVDYVRINGTQWVENPDQRFTTTLDIREPILRLLPRLESTILDDMPRHFRLDEGESQRKDQPALPQRVVREAVVNAVMHRDYQVHQPVLIVRYSNRLEIKNPGYSLKAEPELGTMGSQQRNPVIAAVLYDLDMAETKGSGIGLMRRVLKDVGLTAPTFISDRHSNQFTATYLLHQLMGEEQLNWLQRLNTFELTKHEQQALLLAKETGAVDNAALRAITGLDTLSASSTLRKLNNTHNLLKKGGNGPSTYYQLTDMVQSNTSDLDPNTSDLDPNTSDLDPNTSDLDPNTSDPTSQQPDLPPRLIQWIDVLTPKARKEKLWPIILWLCEIKPQKADMLAKRLNRETTALKNNHLNKLRKEKGYLAYTKPEVINHPDQAYRITEKGRKWLYEHKEGHDE